MEETREMPIVVGNTYQVEILSLAAKGDGVAKIEGLVVFVAGTKVGDKVEIEITRIGAKFAFGQVLEFLE